MSRKKYRKPETKKPRKTAWQICSEYALHMLVAAYVFLFLCIFPIFYDLGEHGKYFNMGNTKYAFFKWVSIVGLCLIMLVYEAYLLSYRREKQAVVELHQVSAADYFLVVFLTVSLLSYIFSSFPEVALWGYRGWYMGLMSQFFFGGAFLFVSRYWKWSSYTLLGMVVSAAICYQTGILQRFGFNPMGMYDRLGAEDIEKFLSTLGQTSWYSSYAVLVLPFGFYFYQITESLRARLLTGMFVALGFGMLCTTNSDSAYVAVTLILMVCFCYALESNEKMRRFLEIVLIALGSFRVIGWMHALFPERQRTYITGEEKITKFITGSPVMLVLLILFLFLYAGFRIATAEARQKEGKTVFDISAHKAWIWKLTTTAAVLVIWGVLLLVILVTTGKLQIGDETSFFYFGESWGNHRGFNWRMAARAISHASIKDLLIGVGPDCFDGAMDTYCAAEVAQYWDGLSLACAHNEYLNMLVTEGVLGVVSYLGIFLAVFLRAAKRVTKEPVLMAFMGSIVAYLGHNIFCYQQCICTPVIFILMGITEMINREADKAIGKEENAK